MIRALLVALLVLVTGCGLVTEPRPVRGEGGAGGAAPEAEAEALGGAGGEGGAREVGTWFVRVVALTPEQPGECIRIANRVFYTYDAEEITGVGSLVEQPSFSKGPIEVRYGTTIFVQFEHVELAPCSEVQP